MKKAETFISLITVFSDIKQRSPKIQLSALESNRAMVVEDYFIPDIYYVSVHF